MSELTIGELVKIIIGVLVVVAVVLGIFMFFTNSILDFFKNIGGNSTAGFILGLLI